MPSVPHLSAQRDMQLQSESIQPTLQMQIMALARPDAFANALAQVAKAQAQARVSPRLWVPPDTRAWAQAQALVKERVQVWAEKVLPEEQLWALVNAKAKVKVTMITYNKVLADSELMDIIYSLKPNERHGLARDLWRHSEYWWLIQVLTPITRLPQELLHQIFLIIIDNASHSLFVLMQVCKLWYTTVTGIWASLKLGTTTPRDAVTRKLERNPWVLDVVINTEIDRGHLAPSEGAYQALFATIQAASRSRWRSLVVETFPVQTDLPEHLVNNNAPMLS